MRHTMRYARKRNYLLKFRPLRNDSIQAHHSNPIQRLFNNNLSFLAKAGNPHKPGSRIARFDRAITIIKQPSYRELIMLNRGCFRVVFGCYRVEFSCFGVVIGVF